MTTGRAEPGAATGTESAAAGSRAPAAGTADSGRAVRLAGRVGRSAGRAAATAARGTRRTIRRHPRADRAYRVGVGVVGGTTVAVGVALIPTPGPGAVVALGGLGILATEFEGAKKVSRRANATAGQAYRALQKARRGPSDDARAEAPTS